MIDGMKNIYETAKNGGDYSKFYDQYKKKYTKELDKAIRSFIKVIEEHKMWIDNPNIKLGENPTAESIAIHKKKWQRDIDRNSAYKDITEGLREERLK